MRAYSQDLRERVLADCDARMGTIAVSAKYRVSQSWVNRLKQRRSLSIGGGNDFGRRRSIGNPPVSSVRGAKTSPYSTGNRVCKEQPRSVSFACTHELISPRPGLPAQPALAAAAGRPRVD